MKKFILKYIYAALAASVLFSCTKLDEKVYHDILAEKTKFTAADVPNLMATGYTTLRDVYWGWDGLGDMYEESGDCMVVPNRIGIGWGDYYVTYHQHTFNASLPSFITGFWYNANIGVTNINRTIKLISNISDLSETDKANAIAEMRALRAYYFYLWFDNFRNIPVITTYDIPADSLPPQWAPQKTFDFIVSELNEAMPLLSTDNTTATYGRFTQWAAKMTLAKLYLNYEVYFGTSKWAEAQAQVESVIASGKFSSATNYRDPFLFDNQNSVEQIFSIPFDAKYANGCYHPFKALHPASQATFKLAGQPWDGSAGIPQFINTYDPEDSRLKDTWLGGVQKDYKGDTIFVDKVPLNYANYLSEVTGCYPMEGYRLAKYEIRSGEDAQTGNDVPLFRYTDALMIKAECLLRTGHADDAATIVTQVRQRDFKSNPAKATVTGAKLSGGSVYQYGAYSFGKITTLEGGADVKFGGFLDELGWEFVGEHHRKQDLIRFDVYTKKSWFCKTVKDDNKKIFPIPEFVMNANSKLVQNKGY